jgi:hypothetical protein
MITVMVRHTIGDFDVWKAAYDAHEPARREHGCNAATVHRTVGAEDQLLVALSFGTLAEAQGFLDDPRLGEAMRNAGVQGPPEIVIVEAVEALDYAGVTS